MDFDLGSSPEPSEGVPAKIASWLDYLLVSDWFESVVCTCWSVEDTHDLPRGLTCASLEMGRWIGTQTPFSPEPLFELTRAIAAKDPLDHWRPFHVSVEEVDRLRWKWWFYAEMINQIAVVEAPLALPEDSGPADIYTWRWQGRTIVVSADERMKPAPWNLSKQLWLKWGRRVAVGDLVGKGRLFDEMIEDDTVGKHGSNATKWFRAHQIPLK